MRALEPLLERTVGGLGYELADFDYSGRGRVLRVFIDKRTPAGEPRESAITLDDCEAVSRQLQRVLAVEGVDYERLEVSSPGLDRRLKKSADFARFAGRQIHIRLRRPIAGRRNFTGAVGAVEDERVRIDLGGECVEIALEDLEFARLVPQFQGEKR